MKLIEEKYKMILSNHIYLLIFTNIVTQFLKHLFKQAEKCFFFFYKNTLNKVKNHSLSMLK